ncbi:uncharacterized protein [Ambystoma mexicanum]|uniref:uncharacterized protein isoform X2 n=1 Tax=Ambystoma mexicanum TaxID=8296 RepID=UPI0037E8184C
MTSLSRTAVWIIFLSSLHHSSLATPISCNLTVSARCQRSAEIHCSANDVIERVWVSREHDHPVSVWEIENGETNSSDPKIRVEVLARMPNDKSKVIVQLNNISFSDENMYTLYVETTQGYIAPTKINLTVTGFCTPRIFVPADKQEIVCQVIGKGEDGHVEWSYDDQNTWSEGHGTKMTHGAGGMVTLTSMTTFEAASHRIPCCRVAFKQNEVTPSEAVCFHSFGYSSTQFPIAEPQENVGTDPERTRKFLIVPIVIFTIAIVRVCVALHRGRHVVLRRRGRTLSETPILE